VSDRREGAAHRGCTIRFLRPTPLDTTKNSHPKCDAYLKKYLETLIVDRLAPRAWTAPEYAEKFGDGTALRRALRTLTLDELITIAAVGDEE
jgi:hypothetical protein